MGDRVSDQTLSDLVTGRRRANPYVNTARAVLGQGLGMGWGDEAEAWLRSKMGEGDEQALRDQIRQEYGTYAKEHPYLAGTGEFVGGALPGLAMMVVPGGQPAGAAQLTRSTLGSLARLGATGAATGAVAGAGSATEGNRGEGAGTGAVLGGVLGVGVPLALRGTSAGYKWLSERLFPTDAKATENATQKMYQAMQEAGLTPQQIQQAMARDVTLKAPSVVANVNPSLTDLAEAVAQRTGSGARKIEDRLNQQKQGTRDRVNAQTTAGLKPAPYYKEEQDLVTNLRNNAKTVYDTAYAHGDVDDPRIVEVLKNPQFKAFFDKARAIAETEAQAAKLRGEDPKKFMLPEIYKPSGKFDANGNEILELTRLPDVRTLDYIKRGIDATIDSGFRGQGMSTAEASALRGLRKEFVNALDQNVPAYKAARQSYAGDMEVLDALRMGKNDFGKLDHEQVADMVKGMSIAELDAFRTGVARDLYSTIMKPSGNFNAAQRLIGSPEMRQKLAPLFDSPAHFDLFKAALERESQLFNQANKVLGGSQTGKRMQMRENLEATDGIGETVANAVTGGWTNALTGATIKALRSGQMTEKTASKLADMLMAKDPHEVAAVVKILEDYGNKQIPKAVNASAKEMGAVTGTASAIFPSPYPKEEEADITKETAPSPTVEGPDIEADIAARNKVK